MSTNNSKFFAIALSQFGNGMSGFAAEDVMLRIRNAIRGGDPFVLHMRTPTGYNLLVANPNMGGMSFQCNLAQDADGVYQGVPCDAAGNVCDPSVATAQIPPAQATMFHIAFAPHNADSDGAVSNGAHAPAAPKPDSVPTY